MRKKNIIIITVFFFTLSMTFSANHDAAIAGGPTSCNTSCYATPMGGSCDTSGTPMTCKGDLQGSGYCKNGASGCNNWNCSLCGSASTGTYSSAPSSNLCGWANDATSVSDKGTYWQWQCKLHPFYMPWITCTAAKPAPVVNGACGTANGGSYATKPTASLCTSGTATIVSGTGPWTWNCKGSGGGSTASCGASVLIVNAACGTANKTYPAAATGWGADTFCAAGTSTPASPVFPVVGATTNWSCAGLNGGTSCNCSALHQTPGPTLNLIANPTNLPYAGGSSLLTWTTTNAVSCTASNGWSGPKNSGGGSESQTINSTTTFSMECWDSNGVSSGIESVTVTVAPPPPAPTLTLNADDTVIDPGDSSNLIWTTANTTSCTATNGWSGSKNSGGGSESQTISSTTTFDLECWNSADVSSGKKTVTICVKNCSNNANTCSGVSYSDGCGGNSCVGTLVRTDCEKDTCIGSTCTNCPGGGITETKDGTKDCRDNNWKEVSPN